VTIKPALLFGVASVVLAALGVWRYRVETAPPEAPTPALRAEQADLDLGERPPGDVAVRFRLLNVTSRPIRVVGQSPCCGKNSCLGPAEMGPFEIEANGSAVIVAEASLLDPGPFECPMYITYLQDGRYEQIKFTIKGTCVAPGAVDVKAAP